MPRNKKKAAKRRVKASAQPTQQKRTAVKPTKSVKPHAAKTSTKSAGANRAAGLTLFNLAGRPTREQFILVYGESGPTMTWDLRAKAGVPAEKFQSALAAAMRQAK